MLRLDDTSFMENTIIDLVVYPEMPVASIIYEITQSAKYIIILDTQGNLYEEFNCTNDKEMKDTGMCTKRCTGLSENVLEQIVVLERHEKTNINQFDTKVNNVLCYIEKDDNVNDRPTSDGTFTEHHGRLNSIDKDYGPALDGTCTQTNDYLNYQYVFSDTALSSFSMMEEHDNGITENVCTADKTLYNASKRTEYHLIAGMNSLMEKIERQREKREFVLVIDSITFAADCSFDGIKNLINLLWSLIYECNATVITINHYRIGRVNRTTKLVPRMGFYWELFITYQVFIRYKNNEIEFIVKTNDMPGKQKMA